MKIEQSYSSSASIYALAVIWAISVGASFYTHDIGHHNQMLVYLVRVGVAVPTAICLLLLGIKTVDHETPFDWFGGWDHVPMGKVYVTCALILGLVGLCIWS